MSPLYVELQYDDGGFRDTFQCSHSTEIDDDVKTRLCSRLFLRMYIRRYASPVTSDKASSSQYMLIATDQSQSTYVLLLWRYNVYICTYTYKQVRVVVLMAIK